MRKFLKELFFIVVLFGATFAVQAGITPGVVDLTARSAAAAAQGTANTGVANAATAQSTANTGVANAATAQSTANNAQASANSAITGSFYGSTVHNLVGSRTFGSSYTNSTGKVMFVMVTGTNGSIPVFTVDGVGVCHVTAATSNCSFVVPVGSVYASTVSGGSILRWAEIY